MIKFVKVLSVAIMAILLSSCEKRAPITTSFRQSSLDNSGLVLQVRNTGDHHLCCYLTVKNKMLEQQISHSFNVAPYSQAEIGLLETGWTFKTGESCEIEVEGFRSISFKVQ